MQSLDRLIMNELEPMDALDEGFDDEFDSFWDEAIDKAIQSTSRSRALSSPPANRDSREHLRWVQNALNRVMDLQLATDGIMGVQTRNAIRRFQQQRRLPADGRVGPQTESALMAAMGGTTTPTAPRLGQPTQRIVYGWGQYRRRVEELPPDQRAILTRVGNEIIASYQPGQQPVRTVQVYGHADWDTPRNPQREQQMSDERSQIVTNWLKNYVGSTIASQITWKVKGFGATQLKASPTTEANRRQNRRVEIFWQSSMNSRQGCLVTKIDGLTVIEPTSNRSSKPSFQAVLDTRNLVVFGNGFISRYRNNAHEIQLASAGGWLPSNYDLVEAAFATANNLCRTQQCRTLMRGMDTFEELLYFIGAQEVGSINQLYIVGHADPGIFSLGGKMVFERDQNGPFAHILFDKRPDAIISPSTINDPYIQKIIKTLKLPNRFQRKAEIILCGCHSGANQTLLNELSKALQVCVKGFEYSICWCFTHQRKRIISRGHVWYEPDILTLNGYNPDDCGQRNCLRPGKKCQKIPWCSKGGSNKRLDIFHPEKSSQGRCASTSMVF